VRISKSQTISTSKLLLSFVFVSFSFVVSVAFTYKAKPRDQTTKYVCVCEHVCMYLHTV